MPNRFLIGNGHWCSCCFPDGPPSVAGLLAYMKRPRRERRGCNECVGKGRVRYSAEAIIAEAMKAKHPPKHEARRRADRQARKAAAHA